MDSQLHDSNLNQSGSQPTAKRKIYNTYNKDSYMSDLNAIIRDELQKDQGTNARQKLMMKRNQQVADDQFKVGNRLLNLKKKTEDGEEEKGMGLLHMNLDRQKIEREAKKQQYKYELARQLKEREGINTKEQLIDKISQMPPVIYSASAHPMEDSKSQHPSQDRLGRGYRQPSTNNQDLYSRVPQERQGYNNRVENIGQNRPHLMSEDGISVIKPSSAHYNERIPSANEYYSLSIPDHNPPGKVSTFQKASATNLTDFRRGRYQEGQGPGSHNNEFFDKHFGSAHERKKRQQQELKEQLVMELQSQMELKKEKQRREKAEMALEDQMAEDRYLRELNKINEQSVAESKKRSPNLFAEGLNDTDIATDFKKEKEYSYAKSMSLKTIPKEPEMHSVQMNDPLTNPRPQPELSVVSKGGDKQRQGDMSFAGGRDLQPTYGQIQTVSGQPVGRDMDALGMAMQQYQQPPSRYQEYSQRVTDFAMERMDEKKRELRMNTNLLYQQLIDLRGEKNYTDNLKDQAFQNYDTVRRNLEKQNKILDKEIRAVMGAEPLIDQDITASSNYLKEKPFNPLGWGSDSNAPESRKLHEYRKQGLKLIDDVATRPRNSKDPTLIDYRLEPDQGGYATTGEGEIIINAETELIPIKYKQVDRKALSKFEHLDQEDIVKASKKEAKQERITDQIKYQTPEERLEDLKRRNLDFDTLMNEMTKECRHIYEDEIGIRPIQRGEGVETLDQIIDNLYNDDFKVKNLPPKTKATNTEPSNHLPSTAHNQKSLIQAGQISPHHESQHGLITEKYKMKVHDSPENVFDSFGGQDSIHGDRKAGANPFMLDSYVEDSHNPTGNDSTHLPHFGTDNPQHLPPTESSVKQPPAAKGKPHDDHQQSPDLGLSGHLSFGQASPTKQSDASFGDQGHAKAAGDKEDSKARKHVEEVTGEEDEAAEEAGDEEGQEEAAEEGAEDGDEEGGEEGQEEENEEDDEEEAEEEGEEEEKSNKGTSKGIEKNHKNDKNDSLGEDGGSGKQGGPKGVLANSNGNTPRGEDLNRSESKKKVTFSSEIENKKPK